jgi:transposase
MSAKTTLKLEDIDMSEVLHVAFELGNRTWKIASRALGAQKARIVTIEARDLKAVGKEFAGAKERFRLPPKAPVVSCYEAGREGHWLHRWLVKRGVQNLEIDSASIEVNRRKRRAKTDRIDAQKLVGMLVRYCQGELGHMSVVHVPSVEAEDARLLPREIERLKKERTAHWARISSKLALHGIAYKRGNGLKNLPAVRSVTGSPLPPRALAELRREIERLNLVQKQLDELAAEEKELAGDRKSLAGKMISQAQSLRGIGVKTACPLVLEFFAWRKFKNRREVGSLAGMVGTPYSSDSGQREQGISKAGNKRVRWRMVQLAWLWLRYQHQSELTMWFVDRFGKGSSRSRRVGIVALARKLLVALWRFLDQGILPKGARLKPAPFG